MTTTQEKVLAHLRVTIKPGCESCENAKEAVIRKGNLKSDLITYRVSEVVGVSGSPIFAYAEDSFYVSDKVVETRTGDNHG